MSATVKPRCSQCGKRRARRMGLCVKCCITEADARYVRVRLTVKSPATCRGSMSGYARGCRCDDCCMAFLHYSRNHRMLDALSRAERAEELKVERAARSAERRAERRRTLMERRTQALTERRIASIRRYQQGWERTGPRFVPLDALVEGMDGDFADRKSLVVPLDDPYEPQRWLEGQLLDELVGNLSIADIQRMSDDQLAPLRKKLTEAGFAPGGTVQQKERERLRPVARHRGEAPAVTFERMAPRHRKRKDQIALMSGKRTSRKQRGRWEREKVVW